ncbi:MAG: glycosyltransferase family 8 protein [Ferruginibacter sp.]
MTLKQSLNVILTLDKNFIIHFTVALTSLLENNKDLDASVYVIHDLEDTSPIPNVVRYFKEKYNVDLNLITVDNQIFENFHISPHLSRAAYFRLLFADILPVNVDTCLYIDGDIIVTTSLKDLIGADFFAGENKEEYGLLCVNDKNEQDGIQRLAKLGFDLKRYFNSGVLLINLKKWRADNVSEKLIKIGQDFKEHLIWQDQDVLNIYFRNNTGKLDDTYNKFVDHKLSEIPKIIHYSGSSKPWHYFNMHPYKYLYWKYLKLTPFKNTVFEEVTPKKAIKKNIRLFLRLFK